MNVYGELPNPWERLGWARFDLALVGDGVVQRVGPDGSFGLLGRDRAVPEEIGFDQSLKKIRKMYKCFTS